MEALVDLRRDPPNPMFHESAEGESPSADRGLGFASVDGELLGSVSSALSVRQLATDSTLELVRAELQARILANQPAADIAQRMTLPKSLVEQYETKHFDIRSRLAHASVVLFEIIGVPMNDTWMATEVGRFWMWLGFAYGVPGLDLAIPPFLVLGEELQALGLWAYLDPTCPVCEELRIEVASKLLPIAAMMSVGGIRLVAKLQELLRRQVEPAPKWNPPPCCPASMLLHCAAKNAHLTIHVWTPYPSGKRLLE